MDYDLHTLSSRQHLREARIRYVDRLVSDFGIVRNWNILNAFALRKFEEWLEWLASAPLLDTGHDEDCAADQRCR